MAGTSAAATAPRDPTELLEDRRALITFVLQVYRRQGGRVDYPVGVDGSEQWLLDSLEVPLLLDKVKRDRKLDIIQLCKAAKRASQSGSNSSEGDALPQGPCDGAASHQRMNSLDSAWGHHASQPTLPELESSSVQAGFKEHEIQELAYTLFVVCCGSSSDNVLLQKVRQQLELSGARAGEIQQVLALVDRRGRGSDMGDAVNFQLLVRLLKGVKPGDFRKFKDFARWRNALTHLLVENLHQAAISDQETEMDKGMEEVQARVARLKGAVRRLSVSEAEDFEEEEYTEAGEALEVAAGALAVRCSTGWDFPWQLRTQLWEVLLRASFDNLEENMYIEERDALLERLVGCLAPVLGISPRLHMACSAWVHFKQFVITGDPSVASQAQDLLSALRKDAACQNSFQQNGENERSCSQTVYEKVYVANVEKSVVDWIQKILSDYHQHLPAPENLDSLLNILTEGLESTGVAEVGKVTVVEECICSSTSAAFYRTLESHQGLEGPMKLQAMALSTGQLQETELVKYTAHFAGVCPAAADVAARQLHECYGHIYVPILHQLGSSRVLDPEFIRMCKAADELEQQLLGNCAEEREGLKLWDTMGVVQPHLFRWVNEQMKMLSSWRKRLMEGEDWEPVSATSMVPRSAVEFKKLLTDTVVALFALELPIPMQVIFMLLNSFDEILTSYGQGVVNDLGPLSDLVPPLPPMTRYKKDLAVGAVQGDGGQAKLSGLSKVSKKLTTYFKDPGVVPVVPQIEAEPAHNFVSTLTLNRLVVRINAMQFLRDSLPELESLLQMHYAESSQQQTDNNWPTGVLESAEWSLEQSIGTVCTFLATKLVYWDHRQGWLESVYRHCVDQSRIDPILEALDKELGDSCSQTLPAARNRMAAALMHTSVECFERILLDGGPYRLFTPSDVQLLEHDVLKMRLLFLGDGEGLPQAQVDKAFRPLSELLSVMELATGILIDNFLQVQGCSPTKAANGTGDGEKAFNPEILKKILSHRAERAASKFLKKHFSVPKKLK